MCPTEAPNSYSRKLSGNLQASMTVSGAGITACSVKGSAKGRRGDIYCCENAAIYRCDSHVQCVPDRLSANQLNHADWYGAHNYTKPYPGEDKILTPDEVGAGNAKAPAKASTTDTDG
ncbi:MAG: hypothetical protein NVSMB43_11110 [Pseudarthrobacter sp.]